MSGGTEFHVNELLFLNAWLKFFQEKVIINII